MLVVAQLVLHSDHTPTVVLKNVIDERWGEEEEDYAEDEGGLAR